jgi:hypothetical protein
MNENWIIQVKHAEDNTKTIVDFLNKWHDLIKEEATGVTLRIDKEYRINCCKNILEYIGFTEISVEEDGTCNGTFEDFRYHGLVFDAPFVTQLFEEYGMNIEFREKILVKEMLPKRREVISKVPLEFELLHANLKVDAHEDRDTEPE